MPTVRLHLDNADACNGALRVLPGSHRFGRLSAERIQQLRMEQADYRFAVSAGDALLMRLLLPHSSSVQRTTHHCRVLHIEYAASTLPQALDWDECGVGVFDEARSAPAPYLSPLASVTTHPCVTTINAIETQKYEPSLPLAFKMARLFKQPIEEIFTPDKD